MNSFKLSGLPLQHFLPLFKLSDAELAGRNIRRVVATSNPGFPCRISLEDAAIGEELLLLAYEHQPANSPYRSSGPLFVRLKAVPADIEAGVIPDYVRTRQLSVRGYDAQHLIAEAALCAGTSIEPTIRTLFERPEVDYIHLHNAARGCFSCRVDRA